MQNLTLKKLAGRNGPEPALVCDVEFDWIHRDAYVFAIDGRVLLGQSVIGERVIGDAGPWLNSSGPCKQKEHYTMTLAVPLGPRAIQFVEDSRNQGDVQLALALRHAVQEPSTGEAGRSVQYGPVQTRTAQVGISVAKSEWLKRLAEIGWQETELFEVAKAPLASDAKLAEALKIMADATSAFRNGDYKGVLAKCRSALESAAKYESEGNTKMGFEALLARAFSDHPAKSGALDRWLKDFSDYCHLGRHEAYPALSVSQSEARFALTACLAFFSMLGTRLSGRETF